MPFIVDHSYEALSSPRWIEAKQQQRQTVQETIISYKNTLAKSGRTLLLRFLHVLFLVAQTESGKFR
jgi:hypothetical protein